MYLICYVALQNLLIEEACKYMDEVSSLYISTLVSLVNIGIVMVEIYCFWFVTWAQGNMFKQLCKSMGGLYSRIVTIFPCLVSIGLVQVEIKKVLNMSGPHKTTWLKNHVTFLSGSHHRYVTINIMVVW